MSQLSLLFTNRPKQHKDSTLKKRFTIADCSARATAATIPADSCELEKLVSYIFEFQME